MPVKVIFIPSIFEDQAVVSELEPGKLVSLLKEFYSLHKEDYPNLLRTKIVVEIDDGTPEGRKILTTSEWNDCEVKDGSSIHIITKIGGGGGGVIQTVVGFVMIVAGFYMNIIAPGSGIPLIISGIGMMASGIMQSVSRSPSYGYSAPIDGDLSASSPSFSWEVQGNQTDPSLPVPIVYGECRMAPHLINVFIDQQTNITWSKYWQPQIPTLKSVAGYINTFQANQCYGIRFLLENNSPFNVNPLNWQYYQNPQTYSIGYTPEGGVWTPWQTITIKGASGGTLEFGDVPANNLELVELRFEGQPINNYIISIEDISKIKSDAQYWHNPDQTAWTYVDPYGLNYIQGIQDTTSISHEEDIQYLNLLYGVCEGPVDGISQIELNDTPIANLADPPEIFLRQGTNNQDPIAQFNTVRNFKPYGSGGQKMSQNVPLTLTTDSDEIGAMDVYFKIPALFRWDTTSGTMVSESVTVRIEYSVHGVDSWTSQDITITSNSRSSISRLIRIPSDGFLTADQYDVRVTRLSQESSDININNEIVFVGFYEIQDKDLSYPNTALLGLRVKASSQLSGSLPKVTCLVRGRQVLNLDTEVTEFTKNNVYCMHDFLINIRFGLGNFIDSSVMNTNQLITEAAYCDELVDGEPRFQLDFVIDGVTNAFDLINKFGTTMRGLPIYSEGTIQFKIDKPDDVISQVLSVGNIIKDSLVVNYLDTSQIPNVMEVQFLDKENNYEMNSLQIRSSDVEAATVKERIKRAPLMGVTRKSQAIRLGMYAYNMGKYLTKAIQFKAMIDSLHFQPGDLFKFQHDQLDWGNGGRLVAATTSQLTLDKSVTIESGISYVVTTRLDNGAIETKGVNEATTTGGSYPWTGTIIKMAQNFTSAPTVSEILKPPYAFGEIGLEAVTYRAIKISRETNYEVSVQALEFNSTIFDETGIAVPNPTPTRIPGYQQPPPDVINLLLAETLAGSNGIVVSFNIPSPRLNWDHCEIQYAIDTGGNLFYRSYTFTNNNATIVMLGLPTYLTYSIRVVSYSPKGIPGKNPPVSSIYLSGKLTTSPSSGLSPIYNLQIKGETHSNYFYDRDCEFTWNWDAGNNFFSYFRVRVEKSDGTFCREEMVTDIFYSYSLVKNIKDNGIPIGSFNITVWAVDKTGAESNGVSLLVHNANPGDVTGLSAASSYRGVTFQWEASVEPDHKCYYLRTKCDGADWSGYSYIDQNTYTRVMSQTEVNTYGADANLYIEVYDCDVFYNKSANAATANADSLDLATDLSGTAFQIIVSDSDGKSEETLKALYDAVVNTGGVLYTISGLYKYIEYEFPVSQTVNKVLVWPTSSFYAYIAYSEDGVTWSYLKGQADHSLLNGKLLEATDQSDASVNYWTTGAGTPVTAVFPYMRSARWWRLYIGSTVSLYELKFWVYNIADEIDAGILHLARGITIASTEDIANAVKLDQSGLRMWGNNVQKVNMSPNGTFWFGAASGDNSLVYNGTTLTYTGVMVFRSGSSGYNNISDKPYLGYLSGLNSVGITNMDTTIIDGPYIKTGLVVADRIAAGVMTGSTIQTASSGSRTVISSVDKYIHVYNSSGTEVLTMGSYLNNNYFMLIDSSSASLFYVHNTNGIACYAESTGSIGVVGWGNDSYYGGYFSVNSGTALYAHGNFYTTGDCSALTFTDRTPAYKGDALAAIKDIQSDVDGNIDHSTLPVEVQAVIIDKKYRFEKIPGGKKGSMRSVLESEKELPGRDIGAMVSVLTVGIQQLLTRVEKIEEGK